MSKKLRKIDVYGKEMGPCKEVEYLWSTVRFSTIRGALLNAAYVVGQNNARVATIGEHGLEQRLIRNIDPMSIRAFYAEK